MKKLIILSILLATPFLLFSETTERIITGIKKAADIPSPFAVVDVYGSEREAIMGDSRIIISDVMRNKSYNAFTWVFTGNCYRSVKLKYTFSPLTCSLDLSEATEEEIIPYTVTLSHDSTTVGGTTITTNPLASGSGIPDDFGGGYYYCLGEWVRYDGSTDPVTLSINNTSAYVILNYDFSQNSTVQRKNEGNNYTNVNDYNKNVCCLWTRTGTAALVLKVTEDGFSIPEDDSDPIRFTGGEYTCTVSVEIINES